MLLLGLGFLIKSGFFFVDDAILFYRNRNSSNQICGTRNGKSNILKRFLLATVFICGLNFLNITVNVWAAEVPYIDEISGKVQLAVAPSSRAFWKILKLVDTEGIIDHQNDEYLVLQGHVSVVFLNGWKSISIMGKKFQAIIDKVSKYDDGRFIISP